MTARQNARIKRSVRAAFYPCCALGRDLGSEGLALGSVGRMSFSRANTLYISRQGSNPGRPHRRRRRCWSSQLARPAPARAGFRAGSCAEHSASCRCKAAEGYLYQPQQERDNKRFTFDVRCHSRSSTCFSRASVVRCCRC